MIKRSVSVFLLVLASLVPTARATGTTQGAENTIPQDIPALVREHKISFKYLPAMSNTGNYLVVICQATKDDQTVEAIEVIDRVRPTMPVSGAISAKEVMDAHAAALRKAVLLLVGAPAAPSGVDPPVPFPVGEPTLEDLKKIGRLDDTRPLHWRGKQADAAAHSLRQDEVEFVADSIVTAEKYPVEGGTNAHVAVKVTPPGTAWSIRLVDTGIYLGGPDRSYLVIKVAGSPRRTVATGPPGAQTVTANLTGILPTTRGIRIVNPRDVRGAMSTITAELTTIIPPE